MVDAELTMGLFGPHIRVGTNSPAESHLSGALLNAPVGGRRSTSRTSGKAETRRGFPSERRNCRGLHYRKFRCAAILNKHLGRPRPWVVRNPAEAARRQASCCMEPADHQGNLLRRKQFLSNASGSVWDTASYCSRPRLSTSVAIMSRRWRNPGTVLTSPRSQAITSPAFPATSKIRRSIRLQSSTDI